MPLDCDEVPEPTCARSSTTTSRAPKAARWYAIDVPITPAPITTTSWTIVMSLAKRSVAAAAGSNRQVDRRQHRAAALAEADAREARPLAPAGEDHGIAVGQEAALLDLP